MLTRFVLQSEPPSPRSPSDGSAVAAARNGVISPLEQQVLGPESAASTPGSFFESLTSSELYKSTQVWSRFQDYVADECGLAWCFDQIF